VRENTAGRVPVRVIWLSVAGALGIGIILSVLQQFLGIKVILYYSTTLWKAVGFREQDSLTISVITAIVNVLVTVIAIALVDRIGRRPILLAGSVGMGASLMAMAAAFAFATGTGTDISLPGIWAPVALVASHVFVVSFGASWGPVVWGLLGGVFPSPIRARAPDLPRQHSGSPTSC
jgi:SP family sugar:H+ symporter-like MFS transporter